MNEEAARADRWRAFDWTLAEVREALADLPAEALQALVDEACSQARRDLLSGGRDESHG